MIIQIKVQNPDDGVVTYDKINLYRSSTTDLTASYSLLSTVPIDMSSSVGATVIADSNGAEAYYYRATYYNSTTLLETALADAPSMKGDSSFLLEYISLLLSDPINDRYSLEDLKLYRDVVISTLHDTLGEISVEDLTGADSTREYVLNDNYSEIFELRFRETESAQWRILSPALWKLVDNATGGKTLITQFAKGTMTLQISGVKKVLGEAYLPDQYDDLIATGVVIKVIDKEIFKLSMQSSNEGDRGVIDNLMKFLKMKRMDFEQMKSNFTNTGRASVTR